MSQGACCMLYRSSAHSGAHASRFHTQMTRAARALPPYVISAPTTMGLTISAVKSIRLMPASTAANQLQQMSILCCYFYALAWSQKSSVGTSGRT